MDRRTLKRAAVSCGLAFASTWHLMALEEKAAQLNHLNNGMPGVNIPVWDVF